MMTDYSDVTSIFHDFNDPNNEIYLWKDIIVFAGDSDGGMKVKLGKANVREDGFISIPFTIVDGVWIDKGGSDG